MQRSMFGRAMAVTTLAAAALLASGTAAQGDPAGLTRIFTDPGRPSGMVTESGVPFRVHFR